MTKTLTLLLALFLCSYISHAQIMLTSGDMPPVGWVNVMQKDTSAGVVNFGSKGASQVYDFSMFHNDKPDSLFFHAPTSAQLSAIPGATLAITGDHNTYIFAKNQPTLFSYVGGQAVYNGATLLTPFNPIDTGYKLPTAYGQNFHGTYGFTTTQPGSTFGQPSIYEVRITNTTTYTDTIDGWGTVKTPRGTYNCLRQHRIEHSSTLLEYKLFSFSSWSNVPTSSSLPSNPVVSTSNIYNYLTKETHGTAISFTYDATTNSPLTASWSTTPAAPVAGFGYTLGSGGLVAFHDSSTNGPNTYSWTYGDGSATATGQNPSHTYAASGTYYVCQTVRNASDSSTVCDSVHVTVTAAALVPSANNDTASIVQAGTIAINVAANDVSNNAGDVLCITSVWGAPAGWATQHGCDSVIFHPLNATYTGLDTFYYSICDQQHPTLCDTAMVVVRVTAAPVQQPLINFTVAPLNCGFIITDSTLNADSTHYHIVNQATHLDTTIVDLRSYSNSTTISGNLNVCVIAYSQAGIALKCDTVNIICTGISEIPSSDFSIYPNPASEQIQVDLSRIDQSLMADISAIEIYDVVGHKLIALPPTSPATMSISGLSNGVYVIGISDRSNVHHVLGKFEVIR